MNVHADHAHAVAFPNAEFVGLDGEVERRLSAHGGQHCINVALFQNLDEALHRQRQQINVVCRHRVGHDGGRIGVDERHLDAFFAQRA